MDDSGAIDEDELCVVPDEAPDPKPRGGGGRGERGGSPFTQRDTVPRQNMFTCHDIMFFPNIAFLYIKDIESVLEDI